MKYKEAKMLGSIAYWKHRIEENLNTVVKDKRSLGTCIEEDKHLILASIEWKKADAVYAQYSLENLKGELERYKTTGSLEVKRSDDDIPF